MAVPTQSGSATPGAAAAAAVAPDAVTAELLAKHAAGEKLTPAGYGKLGAFKASVKKLVGRSDVAAKPATPSIGNVPLVGTVAPAQASGDSLAVPAADPALVQRTTGAVLKQLDGLARRYVTRAARNTGADDKTVARFDSAAALPPASHELMTEVSPDVAAAFGIDPRYYPVTAFIGALGMWGTNLWLVVDELKALQRSQRVEALKAQANENQNQKAKG
jgi:hypothetical protein